MPPPDARKSRLAYIDWMRGLACLLMFQTHCYDSWLSPQARQSRFFMYSQLGGTFPAPLFLFLAGISFALVTEKLWRKDVPAAQIARTTIARGAEIFVYGLLFRLQEYVIAWGWAPKSDLLRVDVLNTIGLSMMLMGVMCWAVLAWVSLAGLRPAGRAKAPVPTYSAHSAHGRLALVLAAGGTALLISLLSPPLWTTWRPTWLPWPLESYVDGVHNLGVPQAGLFPVFPWTGFAFAGLAVGFILQSQWAKTVEGIYLDRTGGRGADRIRALARPATAAVLCRRRLLAHQPEFLSDPGGDVAGDSGGELQLVPLGCGAEGIQPADPVGTGVTAGVLGAH